MKYILVNRKPVPEPDTHKWGMWFETEDRRVKQDYVGPWHISTVFLGIDHNFSGKGPSIVFETMIFPQCQLDYQTRCATWTEAVAMHDAAVKAVRRMMAG